MAYAYLLIVIAKGSIYSPEKRLGGLRVPDLELALIAMGLVYQS